MAAVERKLAAVLSADVVGYSRLMASDEDATLRRLAAYREQVSLLVEQNRGRVVDFTGDNFLAEFPTALEAAQCAVEIQRVLKGRNADLPADQKMEFRIGVHLGDIRVEEGRIYGDGVNIAARLEGLAEPGGICISGTVHEQIRHRLELGYEDLGEQEVKNIPDPVRVFRLRVDATAPAMPADRKSRRVIPVIAAGLGLVAIAAVVLWALREESVPVEEMAAPTEGAELVAVDNQYTVPGFGGAPAIAVLPFDNLSGDPEQEYFADGIAEDLITRLSSWRSFPVIARNSSFTYKGKAVDVQQVGRELGARYIVEGSVRKAGGHVRISAQLVDATTGAHVWADRYDRKFEDIFLIQDEITTAVAAAMGASLDLTEQQRVSRGKPRDLTAYDLMMRGRWIYTQAFHEWDVEKNAQARVLFERSVGIDPGFAPAYAALARAHLGDWWLLGRAPFMSVSRAAEAARRSVILDPQLADAHLIQAQIAQVRGEVDEMFTAVRRAIALDPSFSAAYLSLGFFLAEGGEPDEAISVLDKGMRLSPRDPSLFEFLRAKSRAHFAAGRYDEAAEWAKQSIQQGGFVYAWFDLAASQVHAGRLDEAQVTLQDAEARLQHGQTVTELRNVLSYIDPDFLDRWLDALRKAGLPE